MAAASLAALLLVDGYNIIGAWSELVHLRDEFGLESARAQLTETLANYSAFKDFHTKLVFDAYGQKQARVPEKVTDHLTIHYTDFGQTADTYIEKACAQFRSDLRKFSHRLIVATSDRAQQLTVVGYGAEWMSAQQLASDVDFALQKVKHRQKPKKKPKGRFLGQTLDADALAKLNRLRMGLPEDDSNPV
jgi:uncharacterized protein